MNKKEYYSIIRSDLIELKKRVKDVAIKLHKLSEEEKEKTISSINSFNLLLDDLLEKIEKLETVCTTEYKSYSGQWEFKHDEIKKRDVPMPEEDAILDIANPT